MHKELIISIFIVLGIFGLNKITQDNTDYTVDTITNQLEVLRQDILKKEPEKEMATEHADNAYEMWEELDDKMAYYIEHNELEKVKTTLTSIRSFVEVEEYTQAVESIDRCIYVLEKIDEREKVTLDNIF